MSREKSNKNLKPFKKGESGNPKGRPKLPDLKEEIAKVMGEEKDGINAVNAVLRAMRKKAMTGDVRAAELLLDRSFGKVKQEMDVDIKGTMESVTFIIEARE